MFFSLMEKLIPKGKIITLVERVGGAVALWLVRWNPDQTALVWALRCILEQDTLLS